MWSDKLMLNNLWSDTRSFMSKHYIPVLVLSVIVVVIIVVIATSSCKSSKSNFGVYNNVNYGASPYVNFVSDSSSEDKYKWVEEEKVDLNTIMPEYNFKSGVVDWRFGDQVYDSDAAVVDDHPVTDVKVVQPIAALLPSSQLNSLPVIETQNDKMTPVGSPSGETVVINVPSSLASSPPVIVPAQPGVPLTVVAPVPAVSTFRSAYY